MAKKKLMSEGMLDTAVKGIVGFWFGKKIISSVAKKRAMRDPKVKSAVQKIKQDLAEFDRIMSEYQ